MQLTLLVTNDLVDDYIQHTRRTRDLAASTLKNYADELVGLVRAGGQMSESFLGDWIRTGTEGPLAPSTRNRRLVILRGFTAYLLERGLLSSDPAAKIQRSRIPRRRRRALSVVDLACAIEAAKLGRSTWIRARDAAIVQVLFSTGLRLGELVRLDVKQVNLEHQLLRDALRKGGHFTDEYLPQPAATALEGYLELRPAVEHDAVFVGQGGGRVTKRTVQLRLARLGELAGLASRLHPHAVRHAHATELDRLGENITVIQESLNHSSLQTTRRYIHLTDERLRAARDRLPDLRRTRQVKPGEKGSTKPENEDPRA